MASVCCNEYAIKSFQGLQFLKLNCTIDIRANYRHVVSDLQILDISVLLALLFALGIDVDHMLCACLAEG